MILWRKQVGIKFIPFGPRVLLEPLASETTIGSIILPDNAVAKPLKARVIALGIAPKHEFVAKVGDIVMTPAFGGYSMKMDGHEYQVLQEDEIVGRLDE